MLLKWNFSTLEGWFFDGISSVKLAKCKLEQEVLSVFVFIKT